ncbi:hypothetical protein SUGI_0573100 [Cryptomeria japonica]|nr:hypothetical protein SUGI_0573100 [Cryptomeria japonica]
MECGAQIVRTPYIDDMAGAGVSHLKWFVKLERQYQDLELHQLLTGTMILSGVSAHRSSMRVLGKRPKPLNLPSQRLENRGLDPNVEILPKLCYGWKEELSLRRFTFLLAQGLDQLVINYLWRFATFIIHVTEIY